MEDRPLQRALQLAGGRLHERRVESSRHFQGHHASNPQLLGVVGEPRQVGSPAGHHNLSRGVEVGHPQAAALTTTPGGSGFGILGVNPEQRRHPGGNRLRGRRHRPPAGRHQRQGGEIVEHPGSGQRGVLPQRVPGGCHGGMRTRRRQRFPAGVGESEQRGLGTLGAGQLRFGALEAQASQRPSQHFVCGLSK